VAPTHRIEGSVLPAKAAGYSALGDKPVAQQTTATYGQDLVPLNIAVVTFYPASAGMGTTQLGGQQWYGTSRCGTLWTGDSKATPRPTQSACITSLLDGVMTTVSGGTQTPEELSRLANAISDVLA
jgi:hypothetical protein